MSLTLARSERVQNVLTHASLIRIKIYSYSVSVSKVWKFCQLACFNNKYQIIVQSLYNNLIF